ncbi:MAG: type IV toxin-antitoxin system AbiEi family antitoxin domain-containing protein [Paludibacteraceae bacterium]|nr:type IV toxin-antitoxin system AbiEi family antitoxin domain-containing protein [Paludibacteraceae bacterium]MBQ8705012.1 type IV toxin-antitoxin system AbiEi family antitoxin domain-containing protein [Paludibacteraceae bacterium]
MQSVEDKILTSLKKSGRGVAFTPARFAHYGSAAAVQKAIERLTENGHIIRVTRGVYCYPKIETELGLGVIYPTFDEIATCLANRDRTLIAPAGAYAINKLGLSTQVPMNAVYVTNGEGRKVEIRNGRSIVFKHAAPKTFAFESSFAQLVSIALKEIGKDNLTQEQLMTLKRLLNQQPRISEMDLKLMPAWVKKQITELYE